VIPRLGREAIARSSGFVVQHEPRAVGDEREAEVDVVQHHVRRRVVVLVGHRVAQPELVRADTAVDAAT
jgi:hypothetical protein